MKEYLQRRISELEARLQKCKDAKYKDLTVMDVVNDNLIIIYVFAISELETALTYVK